MNRREFVQMGTGAFFIASAGRAFGALAPSNRVRLAIVGCHEKGRGFEVMKFALKASGVEIAVVCDVDSRAMDFAADWLVRNGHPAPRKEKDFRKVLEMKDVDGVVSETPDHFHAYSAVMAMRAGKHVYVEKPCAFCPQECEVILSTWKKTGMVFQQGSQRRSIATYQDVLDEMRTGKLIGAPTYAKCWYFTNRGPIGRGKAAEPPRWLDWDLWQACAPRTDFRDNVVHYNWHWFRRWGTGECGNNAIHFVDVARWFLGVERPTTAIVSAGRHFIPEADDWEFYDSMNAAWHFPDGKSITWECNCCRDNATFLSSVTGAAIYGTNGNLLQFTMNNVVRLLDQKGKTIREWLPKSARGEASVAAGVGNRTSGGFGDTTTEHIENFADCIRLNAPEKATANADVGTKTTCLALVANLAHDLGGVIRMDSATGRPLDAEAKNRWSREYEKGWELA